MPTTKTVKRARKAKRQGKSASTQAGEFVRKGEHGARSTKQAIAIGLSQARRAGVNLSAPKRASKAVKASARRAAARAGKKPSPRRSRAVLKALKREGRDAASHLALARHARKAARRRGAAARRRAAKKGARKR